MKKIIILLLALTLFSCKKENQNYKHKVCYECYLANRDTNGKLHNVSVYEDTCLKVNPTKYTMPETTINGKTKICNIKD